MGKKIINLFLLPEKDISDPSSRIRIYENASFLKRFNFLKIKILSPYFLKSKNSLIRRMYMMINIFSLIFIIIRFYNKNNIFLLHRYSQRIGLLDRIRFFILTKILKKNHSKLIFDFDDAVFLKPFNSCEDIIRNADAVFAGSHYLLEYAKKNNNNSFLIPTPVDLPKAFPVKREKNIFKIGWLGSESNFKYLYEIEDELYKALNSFDSQLLIMSSSEPNFKKIAFKFFKWGIEEERFFLEELHAGIMPLSQGEWEKGKCAYKVLKYMSYGAVPLATAFGENIFVIKDGFSGFLIRKKEDWFFYLNFLYSNRTQMEKMSAYAYEEAKNFSREKIVFLQAEILKKI